MASGHCEKALGIQEKEEHDQMTELPRDLKHNNRRATRAKERHTATRAAKHAEKWRRLDEMERSDPLGGATGGIRAGNVSRTKPHARVSSKGHRGT